MLFAVTLMWEIVSCDDEKRLVFANGRLQTFL